MKYVALVLAALLALSVFYPRKPVEDGAALRAATAAREIDRAKAAEQIVRATAEADSLRGVLNGFRRKSATVIVRADTVLVPESTYVYLVDTVLPRCELCALRTDSLVAAMQQQTRSTELVEAMMRREILGLRKTNERWNRLWPLIFTGGVGAGVLLK